MSSRVNRDPDCPPVDYARPTRGRRQSFRMGGPPCNSPADGPRAPPSYEIGRFRGQQPHPVGPNRTPCDNRTDMGTVETIKIARRTGFCYGVREAIDKAKEASAAGKATHTLGPVVHNERVISDLERRGIPTVDTLADVDHGAAVVIRAHGGRPDVMERAQE